MRALHRLRIIEPASSPDGAAENAGERRADLVLAGFGRMADEAGIAEDRIAAVRGQGGASRRSWPARQRRKPRFCSSLRAAPSSGCARRRIMRRRVAALKPKDRPFPRRRRPIIIAISADAGKGTAMPRHPNYIPHGVIPAVLLPFFDDLVDRRGLLPAAPRRCRLGSGIERGHDQRARHRGRVLQLRRAAPRARDHRRRDRAAPADRQRHLCRGQSRGGAARQHGAGGRRLGAAGLPARPVHPGTAAGDGDRPFPPHRRSSGPAAHRLSISAADAGLSARDAAAARRGGADRARDQGLDARTCRCTSATSAPCRACRVR